jgi:hypothetical protein
MKKTLIAAIIVVTALAAVGGYLGYRYWKSTPEYALSRIRSSVKGNDIMMFREYVDLDTVLDRGVDSLLSTMPQDGEDWANALAQGLVKLLKPTLVSETKKGIESWIETGQVPAPSAEGKAGDQKPGQDVQVGQIGQLEYLGIGGKRREGKVCYVTLNLHHTKYDCDLAPELLMRETPRGHLQVVEITNLADVFKELEAKEQAWKEEQNAPAREKIEAAIQVVGAEKSTWQDSWGINKKIVITVTLRNTSDKAITRIEGDLSAATKMVPTTSKKWPVFSDVQIQPGAEQSVTWKFDSNMFIEDETTIFKTPGDQLDIDFTPELTQFADGKVIELPYR